MNLAGDIQTVACQINTVASWISTPFLFLSPGSGRLFYDLDHEMDKSRPQGLYLLSIQ
jgi:hypothetical protein